MLTAGGLAEAKEERSRENVEQNHQHTNSTAEEHRWLVGLEVNQERKSPRAQERKSAAQERKSARAQEQEE